MMTNSLLFLTIFLGTRQRMKAFMLCGLTCPPTVATVMLKDIASLIVQKKRSSRVCWDCRASGHIVAECAKRKNKPFKKVRKTPTAPQDRVDQDEVQSNQASSDIAMSSTSPQPFTSNIMKRKRSIRNESGDSPRIHSSTLLTIEKDSILVSTQEVLKSFFTTPAESQDDIQVENTAGSIGNSHVAADIVIVDQETKNIPQSQHQAAIDGPPLVINSMAPQCSTSMVL
ncbi:hypothetical protein G6F37_005331 [Rhizopus arrhizus]|nr:hypothetical protein G6F38_005368 [Rhizopus arrhizus]KAG1158949.1 hypothetical protein G6F37_005331 [Rhizopus arrhizus]